jgi:hypothetical protein
MSPSLAKLTFCCYQSPFRLAKDLFTRACLRGGNWTVWHRCREGRLSRAALISVCLLAAGLPSKSHSASLTDLLGVNDSIDKSVHGAQAVVDRAREAALAIEAQTNHDATDRLNQVDAIVEKAVAEVKALLAQAFANADQLVARVNGVLASRIADISSLEKQFMADLAKLIDDAQCAVDHTAQEALKDALGDIGKWLGANRIEITPPVMFVGERKALCVPALQNCEISREFKVKTPFSATYEEISDYLIGRLDGARDDTPIKSIVNTYQYIAELAKRTGCFLPGSKSTYDEDFAFYIAKARQWRIVTGRQ